MPFLITSDFSRTLFIRNHFLDFATFVTSAVTTIAEISLALCGLLVENVRLESMSTLNLAGFCELEALFCAAVCFNLRHFKSSLI